MEEKKEENVEELAKKLEEKIFEEQDDRKNFSRRGSGQEKGIGQPESGDWEELEPEDYLEEEDAPSNPWVMAAAFVGLVFLAAVICAVLWHFTHLDKSEGESLAGAEQSSGVIIADNSKSRPIQDTDQASPKPSGTDPAMDDPALSESGTDPSYPVSEPATDAGTNQASSLGTGTSPDSVPSANAQTSPSSGASNASTSSPKDETQLPVQEPVSGTSDMTFTAIEESVTPKDVVNLRSEPSTLDAENIVAQAQNGEVLTRTGVNADTGWTRLEYNGQTVYAVSQYLTVDLTYQPPVQKADPNRVNTLDGRIILFTDVSDNITPKEYVNLRTEPSTSEGESTVRCQISNGEVLHRTGYSPDAGWSRVEYNGEVLYVVSSYVYTVE